MSRIPIYLDRNTVALIHVYKRFDHIEDLWITDFPPYDENKIELAKQAAKQFIDQLEDRWTPLFLEHLKSEIESRLEMVK